MLQQLALAGRCACGVGEGADRKEVELQKDSFKTSQRRVIAIYALSAGQRGIVLD